MSGYCVEDEVDDIPRADFAEMVMDDDDDTRSAEEI